MATGPEGYAGKCEDSYVECICEVKVTMEGFDVINGNWISFGLAGIRRSYFGSALALGQFMNDEHDIDPGTYSEGAMQKVRAVPWSIIDCMP